MNDHVQGFLHFRLRSVVQLTALTLCLTVVWGCTKAKVLVPVTGTVLVGGKPAEKVLVLFHPVDIEGGVTASGVTDEEGMYTLVTSQAGGVEPGKYKVTATWPDPAKEPPGMSMKPVEDAPDLLKGQYASVANAKLEAEIDAETTELKPFELTVK